MYPTISTLTEGERTWIGEQLVLAANFVKTASPSDADQAMTLAALDRAFAAWLVTPDSDDQTINGVINCVGVALGQSLVDGAGFEWVIATDEAGTDIAILALPDTGKVLIYPTNFVAKRWERRESDFLEASFRTIVNQVREIARMHDGGSVRKSWWKFWQTGSGPADK